MRYNNTKVKTKTSSYIENVSQDVKTYEGADGWTRTQKSELFVLGVSSFNENKFYETAAAENQRMTHLVKEIAKEDPEWLGDFTHWLRTKANLRAVSIAIALETAKAMIDNGMSGSRNIVSNVLQRADEPAEAIAYWYAHYGRKIPAPVKRGIADAVRRLYTEQSIFKYDSSARAFRFADVIQLVHPAPKDNRQSDVFKYALDRRYDKGAAIPSNLAVASSRAELKALSGDELRKLANSGKLTEHLRKSAMTWEALSSVISGGMDAKAWEAVIPLMGYMALLRNLRNFLDAGVDQKVLKTIADRLSNEDEVANSKQLPFRFFSAYNETKNSMRFQTALDDALNLSLKNVPELGGKTLILVDMSGSMFYSGRSSGISYADSAAIFGAALALRAEEADLVVFGSTYRKVPFKKSDSILTLKDKMTQSLGGTDMFKALSDCYNGHDRVVILTDEQYSLNPYVDRVEQVVGDANVFVWNLAGYAQAGHSNNVFTSGGLSDAAFGYISMIEAAKDHSWPWTV